MHHDPAVLGLLHVTAALAVIVAAAQVCGRVVRRVGQPAVVGEMLAGILLGPTLLGWIAPGAGAYLFDAGTRPVLYTIAMIGLALYMFLVGASHRHPTGSRSERALPVVLAATGLAGPIVVGGGVGYLLTRSERPEGIPGWLYALFLGGALSVAAFPMLARVLQERDMTRTRFGRVAISAAAVDDVFAWCVLAVCTAVVLHGDLRSAVPTLAALLSLTVVAFTVLPPVLQGPARRVAATGQLGDGLFGALLVIVLAVAWLTDYVGVYSVFGGFIVGAALPRVPGFSERLEASMLQTVRCLFLPVFFAYSGLNTNLRSLAEPTFLVPLLGLLVVAVVAKAGAGYVALRRVYRWPHGEALAMGALMNARGLMILIFINAGLSLGLISDRVFSMLVAVAVVTTALAVPLYRMHFTPRREAEARAEGGLKGQRPHVAGTAVPASTTPSTTSIPCAVSAARVDASGASGGVLRVASVREKRGAG